MFSSGWARFAGISLPTIIEILPFGLHQELGLGNGCSFHLATPPIRHKAFSDVEGVRQFITQRPMHSCFYSTAYWHKPYEMKMVEKDWIGADLIFDLDGDHLPGVTDRDFPAMLEVIQEQAFTLWNDYLEPEFGFDEKIFTGYIFRA